MFLGNVYSPNVVARYCNVVASAKEFKKCSFKLFQLLVLFLF